MWNRGGEVQRMVPVHEWAESAERRKSKRRYTGEPLTVEQRDGLAGLCDAFRRFPAARAVLVPELTTDVFRGPLAGYGKITGAPAVLLFIGDTTEPRHRTMAGYTGEGLVLDATRLGLDACWVAVFKRDAAKDLVELGPTEQVIAISPVGVADASKRDLLSVGSRSRTRKPLSAIAPGIEGWPRWAVEAVTLARLAPSGMNGQPWRFRYEDGALVVGRDRLASIAGGTVPIDCGIAMLHAELGALEAGTPGHWEWCDGQDVARYVPSEGAHDGRA